MAAFPLEPESMLNVAAAAALAALLTQWLKVYLPEWRYTNLLVLGLAVGIELSAAWLSGAHTWWGAVWAGFIGASVATFSYETVMNLLGVAGAGARGGRDT